MFGKQFDKLFISSKIILIEDSYVSL